MNEGSRAETVLTSFEALRRRSFARRLVLFYVPAFVAFLLSLELIFLALIWPDWDSWRAGEVPASALIKDYQERLGEGTEAGRSLSLPPLRWTPVVKPFPQHVRRVFVLAEDSRFYEHGGVDLEAILQAIEYNFRHGRILLGASTITQQTAKNMFLSLSRSPLRKWHELLLTFLLEAQLSKEQILHVYLNVAEFGPGVFGLEAAAKRYFKTSAQSLRLEQAIELAAALPSPKKNNPETRTRAFQKRVQRIGLTLQVVDRVAAEAARPSSRRQALEKSLEELQRELKVNPIEPAPPPENPVDEPATPSYQEEAQDKGQDEVEGTANQANEPLSEPKAQAEPEPSEGGNNSREAPLPESLLEAPADPKEENFP